MKRALLACLASGFLALIGCATNYQAAGLSGGYSDVRIDANTFRVDFHGNAYTSRQTVETHLLRRCAELTAQAGYDYFIVMGANTEALQNAYTTPSSYNATTTGHANVIGNTVYGSADTTGTFRPGQTFVYTRYGASTTIKVFRGEKPVNNPNAYYAREVLHYVGAPSSQPVIEKKALQGVKRYAQLTYAKGPSVAPQVLQAEYMDTGEGYGPARVIYPDKVLEGSYRTIASGQSFKGVVKATLIDPDGAFPGSGLRGFAAFTGTDGTILECAYGVNASNGTGSGTCIDNQKNQYRLSF